MNDNYGIIGQSGKIKDVLRIIEQVAATEIAVLILGESGTGKEVVARAIHHNSARSGGELVSVNCGAIPEGILESELFGHEKGSFTGAVSQRIGYFERAQDGTIFLDEIGEMSLITQVKLLRVLESGEFIRVGGTKNLRTNARIIAATNKELDKEVSRGNFRQDLYYRLKSVSIKLPTLRDRTVDIPLLIEHFLNGISDKYGVKKPEISSGAMRLLADFNWPGNVRELKNSLESIALLNPKGVITEEDIPEEIVREASNIGGLPVHLNKTPDQAERELIYSALLGLRSDVNELKTMMSSAISKKSENDIHYYDDSYRDISEYVPQHDSNDLSVEKIEQDAILEALKRFHGNRRLAAKALGISERTLYRKIKKIL